MRLLLILLEVFLLLLMLSIVAFAQEERLNIIYTGSLQGQLEPCGCSPKSDYGGIARVAGYLIAHEEELSPYVLLDAGNFSDKDTPQGRLKVEAVLKLLSLMKYDAVAFSEKEQFLLEKLYMPLLKGYDSPFVSGLSGYKKSVTLSRNLFRINVSTDPKGSQSEKLNILLTNIPVSDAKALRDGTSLLHHQERNMKNL